MVVGVLFIENNIFDNDTYNRMVFIDSMKNLYYSENKNVRADIKNHDIVKLRSVKVFQDN